jgi:hypothetical protein
MHKISYFTLLTPYFFYPILLPERPSMTAANGGRKKERLLIWELKLSRRRKLIMAAGFACPPTAAGKGAAFVFQKAG